ncbi:MAG: agmatinase [Promethearchaeota archaeon]
MASFKERKSSFFEATVDDLDEANLIVLGIPWDASSSYRKSSATATKVIRQATSGELYNPYTENNVNIRDKWFIFDAGDVEISSNDAMTSRKEVLSTLSQMYNSKKNQRFLFLGGDHLITYFTFYALCEIGYFQGTQSGIIYLDAHPDLYYQYKGNLYSHACVLRRILDQTKIDPKNVIQIGIRASTKEQRGYAFNSGIKTIYNSQFIEEKPDVIANIIKEGFSEEVEKIYLSIDLDILDPAYAPGLGNPEPGGLTTRELIRFIQTLPDMPIAAFDVVELSPTYDQANITAFAAAKIIKETLGILN